ncbi:MAG TPA: DnaJ C-terminal domain-containing protein [Acidimicrobiia bacterium]|jgi:molecular chaperone DnaJ|nr:DnaJ C-terminal domain-containing protein [Acidimicrobiia bacterium]
MRKEWLETDYYAVLGVSKGAAAKDIKKAYRKLAQQYHPDTNQGDESAERRFKEINEAYDVLGDEETRKEYDHVREMGYFVGGPQGGQQYVRVEDLFGQAGGDASPFDLFGGIGDLFGRAGAGGRVRAQAGRDVSAEITLSFHEAIAGVTRELSVNGSRVKVKIPRGIDDGARIRVAGKGEPGFNAGPSGDLFVKVRVGSHPIFGRTGKHLTITVPITFAEAALGAEINVPTLDGKVRLRIPAGTPTGKTFRVREKGVSTSKETGDLLVTVEVAVPTDLTDEQRSLLEKLRDNGPAENPRSHLGV